MFLNAPIMYDWNHSKKSFGTGYVLLTYISFYHNYVCMIVNFDFTEFRQYWHGMFTFKIFFSTKAIVWDLVTGYMLKES